MRSIRARNVPLIGRFSSAYELLSLKQEMKGDLLVCLYSNSTKEGNAAANLLCSRYEPSLFGIQMTAWLTHLISHGKEVTKSIDSGCLRSTCNNFECLHIQTILNAQYQCRIS